MFMTQDACLSFMGMDINMYVVMGMGGIVLVHSVIHILLVAEIGLLQQRFIVYSQ